MNVVVTGASGHIGAELVRRLIQRGDKVIALYKGRATPLEGLALDARCVPLEDLEGLRAALTGADAAFHLAARITIIGDRDGSVAKVNVEGTRNLLRACREAKVKRVVHFSSIHALQHDPWDTPLDETRALADEGHCLAYDRTKALGEREVALAVKEGLDVVTVNPTSVVGPPDPEPSAIGGVLLRIARGRLPVLVDAGFDWVDVRDVVTGALAALEKGRTGERYLLSGQWLHLKALAQLVAQAAGARGPRWAAPVWMARGGAPFAMLASRLTGVPPSLTFDSLETLQLSHRDIRSEKAKRELGYQPRPLAQTVADTVAWYREMKWL